MALDAQTAQRLWDDRYENELRNFAFKNRYLNEFNDPDDLFQDLAVNVWMKAVNSFNQEAVGFTEDVDRAFNSFFTTILNQYLANLAKQRQTGKSTFFREQVESGDRPLSQEEEGATVMDMVESEGGLAEMFEENEDFERMVQRLDPTLEEVLRYIVKHFEPGAKGKIWKDVRQRWGLTQKQLYNELLEEPDFVDYVLEMN